MAAHRAKPKPILPLCICGDPHCLILYGFCHCGCGEKTPIATFNKRNRSVKGMPQRYCPSHNRTWAPLENRVGKKINKNGPSVKPKLGSCWIWLASCDAHGYGQISGGKGPDGKRKMLKAHRVSWELNKGPIPCDLDVLHKCDNPPCANPKHLFVGEAVDNMKDAASKGRMPRGLAHHNGKFTERQIRKIRRLLSRNKLTQSEIGQRFGVSRSTILAIKRKDNYAYVEG